MILFPILSGKFNSNMGKNPNVSIILNQIAETKLRKLLADENFIGAV